MVDDALTAEPPEVRDVDAAVFETAVLPRLDGARLEFRHDAGVLADAVARGEADAVVLLRPVSVAQIRPASYAGDPHAAEDDASSRPSRAPGSCSAPSTTEHCERSVAPRRRSVTSEATQQD